MCDICKTAKRFPSPLQAMAYLGDQFRSSSAIPSCVDDLIGELAGVPKTKVDRNAESDWEKANHGTT